MKKLMLLCVLSGFLVSACGVKGPLYLPADKPQQDQVQSQQATQSVSTQKSAVK